MKDDYYNLKIIIRTLLQETLACSKRSALDFGWIFSPRTDFILFLFPVVFSFFVTTLLIQIKTNTYFLGASEIDLNLFAFVLFKRFFDVPHTWATAYRIYTDRTYFYTKKRYFLWLILVCFGFVYSAFSVSMLTLLRVVTYLDIFHYIKQQYGWMMFYSRKSELQSSSDLILDKIAIYTITLFPLIWWHSNPFSIGWMGHKDLLIELPKNLISFLHVIHWTILLMYIFRQIYLSQIGIKLNIYKMNFLISTWLAWYIGILFIPNPYKSTAASFLHTIPYLYIVFYYFQRNSRDLTLFNIKVSNNRIWLGLYTLLLAVSILTAYLSHLLAAFPNFTQYFTLFLIFMSVFHYVLDGIIWKTNSSVANVKDVFRFT